MTNINTYKDIIFNLAQSIISKEVITQEKSLFELSKLNREIFINYKQKENIYNIDFASKDVVFLEKDKTYNDRLYKDELKKKFSTYIYHIQYSNEFKTLLTNTNIKTSVEFLNLINSCVEDKFNTDLIKDNLAYMKTKDSSVFIDFINPNNYYTIFKTYSRQSIQNLYISNTVKMMLNIFSQDNRTSDISKYLEKVLNEEITRDWEIYLIVFFIIIAFFAIIYFSHNYLLNTVSNNISKVINSNINSYNYF